MARFTGGDASIGGGIETMGDLFARVRAAAAQYVPIITVLFFVNFLILFGPLLLLGVQQIKGYEPGDADWGVKLADVRGQVEAKQEITRVVRCGRAARSSRRRAASASAACCSSARPAPARRCSPRASRPRSTARS